MIVSEFHFIKAGSVFARFSLGFTFQVPLTCRSRPSSQFVALLDNVVVWLLVNKASRLDQQVENSTLFLNFVVVTPERIWGRLHVPRIKLQACILLDWALSRLLKLC